MLKQAAEGNAKAAEALIAREPAYRRWLDNLPKPDQSSIDSVGIVSWLTQEEEE